MHDRTRLAAVAAVCAVAIAAGACGSGSSGSAATTSSRPAAAGSGALESCLVGEWVDDGPYLHGMTLTLEADGAGVVELSHATYTAGATIDGSDSIDVRSISNGGPYLELQSDHSDVTVKTDIDTNRLSSFWDSANYTCTATQLTLTWNSQSGGWVDGVLPPPFTLTRR